MKNPIAIRLTALFLAFALAGCGNSIPAEAPAGSEPENSEENSAVEAMMASESESSEESKIESSAPIEKEDSLTTEQKNSLSMLYYLNITAEKIRLSKGNRLLLDDLYTSLLNDINPGAIDETTQQHISELRYVIKQYMDVSTRRDRLQYIYNQDKAVSIRNALPNPLSILSITNARSWGKLVTSTLYSIVDSYNSYKSTLDSADKEFLYKGWELDDEELKNIQDSRERAFDYMVDIVQENDIDGKYTLSENQIKTFAEICNIPGKVPTVAKKIQRLEAEKNTYKFLGNYWLELADSYYENSQYEECLKSIDEYNKLSNQIYRKDFEYVRILPKVIVAAQNVYTGDEYINNIKKLADSIIDNTETKEWSLRYFAAQVYLDLYSKTNNIDFLNKVYQIALENTTILVDEQEAINQKYLSDVVEEEIAEPDYRFMTESEEEEAKAQYKIDKKNIKEYNKTLHKIRKTELPPLYEPLKLNCDLLFAAAKELKISESEEKKIEDILQTNTNGIFLSDPVNIRYSFNTTKPKYEITLDKDGLIIPANIINGETKITVTISDTDTYICDDWLVDEVEREDVAIESFMVHMCSEKFSDYKWQESSNIKVEMSNGQGYEPIVFNYKIQNMKKLGPLTYKMEFKEI